MSNVDTFLEELNKQHNRENDLKNSLENKSNSLITVSGIIIPLLFGFGIFVIEKILQNYNLRDISEILLVFIIISNISVIGLAIWSSLIRNYKYPFLHSKFFDNISHINELEVKNYTSSKPNEFNDMLIEAYLKSNKYNFEINEKKAKYIRIGQYIFISSLILVSILIVMVFLYSPPLISLSQ